jgi:hypothetical protein
MRGNHLPSRVGNVLVVMMVAIGLAKRASADCTNCMIPSGTMFTWTPQSVFGSYCDPTGGLSWSTPAGSYALTSLTVTVTGGSCYSLTVPVTPPGGSEVTLPVSVTGMLVQGAGPATPFNATGNLSLRYFRFLLGPYPQAELDADWQLSFSGGSLPAGMSFADCSDPVNSPIMWSANAATNCIAISDVRARGMTLTLDGTSYGAPGYHCQLGCSQPMDYMFGGGVTPARASSWGTLKVHYR